MNTKYVYDFLDGFYGTEVLISEKCLLYQKDEFFFADDKCNAYVCESILVWEKCNFTNCREIP